MTTRTPVVLCILDGWGERADTEHNAIAQAATPHWDALRRECPRGTLEASEHFVGLPAGQMGNSEVGHMAIGAGRIVLQDLPRIDAAIADGSLRRNQALQRMIESLRASGGTAHLLGLASDGGVHAHVRHMLALAEALSEAGLPVTLHPLLDGRDVPPRSAESALIALSEFCRRGPRRRIGTVCGRYFAMDRDQRWERTQAAFAAIAQGRAPAHAADAIQALRAAYAQGIDDEFVPPVVLSDYAGLQAGDGLLMTNFRADRARQLLQALLDPSFHAFARVQPALHAALGMVSYSEALDARMPALFPPQVIEEGLGQCVAAAGRRQLRIAETEKYAHVTFFFNGGREAPWPLETRLLVPSPKVATYDLAPAMAAAEITAQVETALREQAFDLIVVNYANTDMVGHSGKLAPTIAAVEAVDAALGRLRQAVRAARGVLVITADHGNAECLHDADTAQAHTAHTCNPVPIVIDGIGAVPSSVALPHGTLADIAPTVLRLMGLAVPAAMSGRDLLAGVARA